MLLCELIGLCYCKLSHNLAILDVKRSERVYWQGCLQKWLFFFFNIMKMRNVQEANSEFANACF